MNKKKIFPSAELFMEFDDAQSSINLQGYKSRSMEISSNIWVQSDLWDIKQGLEDIRKEIGRIEKIRIQENKIKKTKINTVLSLIKRLIISLLKTLWFRIFLKILFFFFIFNLFLIT